MNRKSVLFAFFFVFTSLILPTAVRADWTFELGKSSVLSNGSDTQTLTIVFSEDVDIDEVRFLINRPNHNDYSYDYGGYFQVTPDGCFKPTGGLGNANVELLDTQCEFLYHFSGTTEVTVPFNVFSTFGNQVDNSVSGIWYKESQQVSSWVRLTQSNEGFDVTDTSPAPPSPVLSHFEFSKKNQIPNGIDVQEFRFVVDHATNIDDLRVIINHPWHAENGRTNSGYLQMTPNGCYEYTGSYGNEELTLLTAQCEQFANMDGTFEFVFPFVYEESFGEADNNQVSVIWWENGVTNVSWQKVTHLGQGFDVLQYELPVETSSLKEMGEDLYGLDADLIVISETDFLNSLSVGTVGNANPSAITEAQTQSHLVNDPFVLGVTAVYEEPPPGSSSIVFSGQKFLVMRDPALSSALWDPNGVPGDIIEVEGGDFYIASVSIMSGEATWLGSSPSAILYKEKQYPISECCDSSPMQCELINSCSSNDSTCVIENDVEYVNLTSSALSVELISDKYNCHSCTSTCEVQYTATSITEVGVSIFDPSASHYALDTNLPVIPESVFMQYVQNNDFEEVGNTDAAFDLTRTIKSSEDNLGIRANIGDYKINDDISFSGDVFLVVRDAYIQDHDNANGEIDWVEANIEDVFVGVASISGLTPWLGQAPTIVYSGSAPNGGVCCDGSPMRCEPVALADPRSREVILGDTNDCGGLVGLCSPEMLVAHRNMFDRNLVGRLLSLDTLSINQDIELNLTGIIAFSGSADNIVPMTSENGASGTEHINCTPCKAYVDCSTDGTYTEHFRPTTNGCGRWVDAGCFDISTPSRLPTECGGSCFECSRQKTFENYCNGPGGVGNGFSNALACFDSNIDRDCLTSISDSSSYCEWSESQKANLLLSISGCGTGEPSLGFSCCGPRCACSELGSSSLGKVCAVCSQRGDCYYVRDADRAFLTLNVGQDGQALTEEERAMLPCIQGSIDPNTLQTTTCQDFNVAETDASEQEIADEISSRQLDIENDAASNATEAAERNKIYLEKELAALSKAAKNAAQTVPEVLSEIAGKVNAKTVLDPIDAMTGAFYLTQPDINYFGLPVNISFTRQYTSISDQRSILGSNWSHNFDIRIEPVTKENAPSWIHPYCLDSWPIITCINVNTKGQKTMYYWDIKTEVFTPQAGVTSSVRRVVDGWILRNAHGGKLIFDDLGYLIRTEDRFSNYVEIKNEKVPLYLVYERYCSINDDNEFRQDEQAIANGLKLACKMLGSIFGDQQGDALYDQGQDVLSENLAELSVKRAMFSPKVDGSGYEYTAKRSLPNDPGLSSLPSDQKDAIERGRMQYEALVDTNMPNPLIPTGQVRERPVRISDALGRKIELFYDENSNLLTTIKGTGGVYISYEYDAPDSYPKSLNEKFLTKVIREDGSVSGGITEAVPKRVLEFEYQWPDKGFGSYNDYQDKVKSVYFGYYDQSMLCNWNAGSAGSDSDSDSEMNSTENSARGEGVCREFEGGGGGGYTPKVFLYGNACGQADIESFKYVSRVADNIVRVQFDDIIESETSYSFNPWSSIFDRAIAQRYGGEIISSNEKYVPNPLYITDTKTEYKDNFVSNLPFGEVTYFEGMSNSTLIPSKLKDIFQGELFELSNEPRECYLYNEQGELVLDSEGNEISIRCSIEEPPTGDLCRDEFGEIVSCTENPVGMELNLSCEFTDYAEHLKWDFLIERAGAARPDRGVQCSRADILQRYSRFLPSYIKPLNYFEKEDSGGPIKLTRTPLSCNTIGAEELGDPTHNDLMYEPRPVWNEIINISDNSLIPSLLTSENLNRWDQLCKDAVRIVIPIGSSIDDIGQLSAPQLTALDRELGLSIGTDISINCTNYKRLYELHPIVGEHVFDDGTTNYGGRDRIQRDASRICRWSHVVDREGNETWYGFNFQGSAVVEAVQDITTPHADWIIKENIYNADGLLIESRRPYSTANAGTSGWQAEHGKTEYSYYEPPLYNISSVITENVSSRLWTPAVWSRRGNMIETKVYPRDDGSVINQTNKISITKYKYEPLFNQIYQTQTGFGEVINGEATFTPTQKVTHVMDYQELEATDNSSYSLRDVLIELAPYGFDWLCEDIDAGCSDSEYDNIIRLQIGLAPIDNDFNKDGLRGFPYPGDRKVARGVPIATIVEGYQGDAPIDPTLSQVGEENVLITRFVWAPSGRPAMINSYTGEFIYFSYYGANDSGKNLSIDAYDKDAVRFGPHNVEGVNWGLLAYVATSQNYDSDQFKITFEELNACNRTPGPYQYIDNNNCTTTLGFSSQLMDLIEKSFYDGNNVTEYTYSVLGLPLSISHNHRITTLEQGSDGRTLSSTDYKGVKKETIYTKNGWPVETTITSNGVVQSKTSFVVNRIGKIVQSCTSIEEGGCSGLGTVTSLTADQRIVSSTPDLLFPTTQQHNADEAIETFFYDREERLVKHISPTYVTTSYSFDSRDFILSVISNDHESNLNEDDDDELNVKGSRKKEFSYDVDGLPNSIEYYNGTEILSESLVYNGYGALVERNDVRNVDWTYCYNDYQRLSQIHQGSGCVDDSNELVWGTLFSDLSQYHIGFKYDKLGRVTYKYQYDTSSSEVIRTWLSLDKAGRVIRYRNTGSAPGYTLYDRRGVPVWSRTPSGIATVRGYDPVNRISRSATIEKVFDQTVTDNQNGLQSDPFDNPGYVFHITEESSTLLDDLTTGGYISIQERYGDVREQRNISTLDSLGRILSSSALVDNDDGSNLYITTEYSNYNLIGQPNIITSKQMNESAPNVTGITTTSIIEARNQLGQPKIVHGPTSINLKNEYRYNGFGEIISTSMVGSDPVKTYYDNFGRKVKTSVQSIPNEQEVYYNYSTSQNMNGDSIRPGDLVSVTSSDIDYVFTYDVLGRRNTAKAINRKLFNLMVDFNVPDVTGDDPLPNLDVEKVYVYDSLGRVSSESVQVSPGSAGLNMYSNTYAWSLATDSLYGSWVKNSQIHKLSATINSEVLSSRWYFSNPNGYLNKINVFDGVTGDDVLPVDNTVSFIWNADSISMRKVDFNNVTHSLSLDYNNFMELISSTYNADGGSNEVVLFDTEMTRYEKDGKIRSVHSWYEHVGGTYSNWNGFGYDQFRRLENVWNGDNPPFNFTGQNLEESADADVHITNKFYSREDEVGSLNYIAEDDGQFSWEHLSNTNYSRMDGYRLDTVRFSELDIIVDHNSRGQIIRLSTCGDQLQVDMADDSRPCLDELSQVQSYTHDYELHFDAFGQLIAVTTIDVDGPKLVEGYVYDSDGKMVRRYDDTGLKETIIYDGVQAVASFSGESLPLWEANWGPGIDNLIDVKLYNYVRDEFETVVSQSSQRLAAIQDYRGNLVGLHDGLSWYDGFTEYDAHGRKKKYDPNGSILCDESSGQICPVNSYPFEFATAWRSNKTGLIWMRNRWYSPRLAQFISHDPLGYVDSYNMYAYVGFDPINYRDPFGTISIGSVAGIVTSDTAQDLYRSTRDFFSLSSQQMLDVTANTASDTYYGVATPAVQGPANIYIGLVEEETAAALESLEFARRNNFTQTQLLEHYRGNDTGGAFLLTNVFVTGADLALDAATGGTSRGAKVGIPKKTIRLRPRFSIDTPEPAPRIINTNAKLNKRQRDLLGRLARDNSKIKVRKKDVSLGDLAKLTDATGSEFGLFTRGGERIVYRGSYRYLGVPDEDLLNLAIDKWRFSGHVHPGSARSSVEASPGDRVALELFQDQSNQNRSVVLNRKGQYQVYTPNLFDDLYETKQPSTWYKPEVERYIPSFGTLD